MSAPPSVGGSVRVLAAPELPADPGGADAAPGVSVKALFALCVGRFFRVASIAPNGWVELEVGAVLGEAPYMRSIWIEPALLSPAGAATENGGG